MDTKYVIFDLDNCIADDSHRIHLIDWDTKDLTKRYAAYHAACGADILQNAALIDRHDTQHHSFIFITGRPLAVERETREWLGRLDLLPYTLIMRNNGDHKPSVDGKRNALESLPLYGIQLFQIDCAYDDQANIVAMYRGCGLLAQQVAIHSLDAYNPPHPSSPTAPQPRSPARLRAPDLLAAGAETFRGRNRLYGDSYLHFGAVLNAFFPDGYGAASPEAFTRIGVFVMCVSKLTRYAANIEEGGHRDSAHDLMVYAAMLEEVTK